LLFDGTSGFVNTTQMGGIDSNASMMAWVNLTEAPNSQGHIEYIAGESYSGNDLDLQFEGNTSVNFYTDGGGHVSYTPSPAFLGHWHMVVATMNASSGTRTLYWDGKPVANNVRRSEGL
jgi:hypothetical protein